MDSARTFPSYWLESLGPAPTQPPFAGHERVDVAIIGGGFAGMSTALSLRRKDPSLRVAVLEAEHVGYGASGRNAGFAMTLFGLALQLTVLRFGKERARQAHVFMERAVDYVRELVERDGVECDFEMSGLLTVATSRAYEKRLRSEIELAERIGIGGVEWLDESQTRARVDSHQYLGARWEPHSALVQPARLVRELRRLAVEAGARVYENSPVKAVTRTRPASQPIIVECERGRVMADRVVFATNAWSAVFPQLRALQFPVFTYIVLTEPLSEAQRNAVRWHGREGIEDARALIHYYRLTPDNRLLMGGGDAYYYLGGGFGRDRNPDRVGKLQATVRSLFPSLREIRFTHTWGGPVSVPLDFAPAMGYVGRDRRLIYNLGCVGHGVSLMTMAGQVLSDLALDRQTELTSQFFVNRFVIPTPPDPIRYVLAQAIRGVMHVADAIDDR
jgi:glycine/D-amino acid oxidase-like deaminating enzyme